MYDTFFRYLTVGTIEEKWGLYVTSVGYAKVEPNDNYPNQKHPSTHEFTWNKGRILNDYYIVFISKGKGIYGSLSNTVSEIEEGTCFFLFPQIWHSYKPDLKSGWEEYWVGFNGYYAKQIMGEGFFDPNDPIINIHLNKDVLGLFRKLIDTVKTSANGYQLQLSGICLQLLGLIHTISAFREFEDDPTGLLIAKAKFLMHEAAGTKINMEDLARELPMGYSLFRKAFKRITNESPNQYLLNLRLTQAKELLLSTSLDINEIADQTGFASVFYFSKHFKIKHGISPNFFRKNKQLNPNDIADND